MSTISSPLFTDLYQFTMMQCYRTYGLNNKVACFDLFFRHNPFNGSYAVIAGIEAGLKFLEALHFRHTEISYLKSLGLFDKNFLQGLKKFHFTGDVYAVEEGTVGFPLAPIMRVEGPLDQCQLVETALLNIINFQTLIASKAARICQEAGYENVLEFGLRRAQGPDGGLTASRAAYVGGVSATSNVLAGKTYGIPVRGTHSHSWVMAHTSELEAFRRYAQVYPNNAVLLVDTYDTLKCGIPNAIEVGLEMEKKGQRLQGIRLDSGDLTYLSIEARKMLDGAGLPDCRIIASGDLDEWIIRDIKAQGAKIDIFGVGTKLASADGDSALSGVYKLAAIKNKGESWQMRLKMADGSKKATYPGPKQVWRLFGADQDMMGDLIELEGELPKFSKGVWGLHPEKDYQRMKYKNIDAYHPLLHPVMKKGKIITKFAPIGDIRQKAIREVSQLHPTIRRLMNPHVYKVSLGPELYKITKELRLKGYRR